MRAIEILVEYARLRKKIRLLDAQIEAKRERAEALSGWSEGDKVQTTHEPDKIGRAVAELADKEAELWDMELDAIDRMEEIEALLRQLRNPDHALVLEYRYIRGMKWSEVAETMHYSVEWVQKLKRKAIKELDRRLKNDRSGI